MRDRILPSSILFASLALAVACGSSSSDSAGAGPDAGSPTDPNDRDAATGSDGSGTTPQGPSLAVALDHPAATLHRGGAIDVTVTVTRSGFDAACEVTLSTLPAGVTMTPASLTIAAGLAAITVHFAATADAAVGTVAVGVTATSGVLGAKTTLSLFVGDGGKLDPTFGTGGIMTLQNPSAYVAPAALAVQTDAAILVGGRYDLAAYSPSAARGGVLRFTAAGALDTTYGSAGLAAIPVLGTAAHVALQSDGQLVVCGPADADDGHLVLARLTSGGVLDTTFGAAGLVQLAASVAESCAGLAIDAAGKITVASSAQIDSVHDYETTVVARFLPSGAMDTSFGSAGIATSLFGGGSAFPTAFALTPAGVFLGVSRAASGSNAYLGIVGKLDLDGHLDTTYATGGSYLTTYQATDILPLPAGALYYALQSQYYKLDASGALDTTFGTAGQLPNTVSLQYPYMTSTVDAGGTLYRFGYDGEPYFVGAVWAYRADGTPDPSFGTGGLIDLHPDLVLYGNGLEVSPDGRLVALASSGETVIYLARFTL